MFDSGNFVDEDKARKEREDRQDRKNPPSTAHGQGDSLDDLDLDAIFSSGGSSGGFPSSDGDPFGNFGSSNNNDPFGGGGGVDSGFQGLGNGFGQPMQQQTQKKDTEEVVIGALTTGGKGLLGFSKEFVNSFKGLDAIFWSKYGATLFKISGIVTLFQVLLMFFGFNTLGYMMGSGISAIIGVLTLSFNNDKARELKGMSDNENDFSEPFDINKIDSGHDDFGFPSNSDDSWSSIGQSNDSTDLFGDDEIDFEKENEDDLDFDEDEDEDEDDDDLYDIDDEDVEHFVRVVEPEASIDDVLVKADSVPPGMHSRAFLYDNYMDILNRLTPQYSKRVLLTEDDEEWDNFSVLIREAQEQMGLGNSDDDYDDDLSEVLSVEKSLLTIKVEASRPRKLTNAKVPDFDKELTNLVSVERGEIVEGRYTRTVVSGSRLYVTFHLNETAMVSVKDALEKEKEFFLDTSNKIPVVFGFDHLGETIKVDLLDVESIITAGMPRGGKSLSVKATISQMVQFSHPKDLAFYFGDVKGQISDWYEFDMAHVRAFESTPENILKMLTHITEVEGERRARIFREAGAIGYKQYKRKHPDADMPVIYVVLDEMTTLSQEFTKEQLAQYKSKLTNIVTKMPNFGVRLWAIPHVIKNEIIPKTVSDSIGCRISVRGDENHIEVTTGAKGKKFPYKLVNAGDCAVKMTLIRTEVFFMHTFLLAKDDEGHSRVLEYQTKLWNRLEPSYATNSISNKRKLSKEQEDLLLNMNMTDVHFDEKGMF